MLSKSQLEEILDDAYKVYEEVLDKVRDLGLVLRNDDQ